MKQLIRILMALFSVSGIIFWAWILLALTQWGHSMAGMGDGAGTGPHDLSPVVFFIIAAIWLLPTMAFVSMLLIVFNLLTGTVRRIAYWYALVFLVVAAFVLFVWFRRFVELKRAGLACALFAVLWGCIFRSSITSMEKNYKMPSLKKL